jgi:hypothetical protein
MNADDIGALSHMLEESRAGFETGKAEGKETQPPMTIERSRVVKGGVGGASAIASGQDVDRKAAKAKAIWASDEIPSEDALLNIQDDRPCPRYEISYKQEVGTQDTFLGFGDKTPGSADASHLVVKIHFPGSTMKELDVDVTKERIKAESKALRLFTYLPVPVDSANGKAQFDTKKEVLTITLPIMRI